MTPSRITNVAFPAKFSPQTVAKEIGQVLTWMFHFMVLSAPPNQVLLFKVNLLGGFWRMIVKPEQR
jgi:hypothetical protein